MLKKIIIAAVVLVSPTEALFGRGNNNNNKVVKPESNHNKVYNIVGGNGLPHYNMDDHVFETEETSKVEKAII